MPRNVWHQVLLCLPLPELIRCGTVNKYLRGLVNDVLHRIVIQGSRTDATWELKLQELATAQQVTEDCRARVAVLEDHVERLEQRLQGEVSPAGELGWAHSSR
jgi:hypothetical protein